MSTNQVTQAFIPGPRLIDGSDLNTMEAQINAAFALSGTNASITALTTVGAGTITAAGIVGGVTNRGGAQSGTAFTDTTDTAALIIAALSAFTPVNGAFYWTYENNTNATATLAVGTGVTLSGNVIVPQLTWSRFLVTKTSATTVTIASVASGSLVTLPPSLFTAGNNTANATMSMVGLTGAQLCTLTIGGSVDGTYALPPAVQWVAATPNAAPGMNYTLTLRNAAAGISVQLSGLSGTTISGTSLLGRSTARTFNVSIDSLSSVTLTGLSASTL